MSEKASAPSASPTRTIWNELEDWAKDFEPWQRYLLATAVRNGLLTDADIDAAYSLLLQKFNLGPAVTPPIQIPEKITGRPSETSEKFWLSRVDGLKGINALPDGATLEFAPGLTVVYGNNGAGKSSFARILSQVCFSRKRGTVLPNIYSEKIPDKQAAKIRHYGAE